jgi:hypothetical protein
MNKMVLLTPVIVGLFAWVAWTKKYMQTLVALASLGGAYSCIIGGSAIHHDRLWFGVVMVAMGLTALLCVAIVVVRMCSNTPRTSHKLLIGVAAIAGLLLPAAVTFLQSRAPDFWGYGRGLSDRTTQSPIFFVEVRGVGQRPTIAYIVRCSDQSTAPKNFLEIPHSVLPQINKRTRVMDRWRSECILLVGRKVGETIEIPLDRRTAQQWFSGPTAPIGEFTQCQKFWEEFVSPRIIESERKAGGAG